MEVPSPLGTKLTLSRDGPMSSNSGQSRNPETPSSHRWAKIGALAAIAAAIVAALGVFFQYANQSSQVDIVIKPVDYEVKPTPDGQFVTVSYTLTAVGAYPALNVRINAVCEAVIPAPEPVLRDQWKSVGDLVPGKETPELCFIPLTYTGNITGIKQSNTVTWKNGTGPKKCSFDGHQIVINKAARSVMSPCT